MDRVIASEYAFVLIDRELEFVNALNSRKLKMAYSTICFAASEIVIPNCCSGACKTDTDERQKIAPRRDRREASTRVGASHACLNLLLLSFDMRRNL